MKRKADGGSEQSSKRSISTSQETGTWFKTNFRTAFESQNSSKVSDIQEEVDVIFQSRKTEARVAGDIDLACCVTEETTVKDLFPATLKRIEAVIPKDSLLLFELTSMGGNMANTVIDEKSNKTKVESKIRFYEELLKHFRKKLFKKLNIGLKLKERKIFVFFVYNGSEFSPVDFIFQNPIENVNTFSVHCPMQFCFNWVNDIIRKEALEEGVKKGLEEGVKEGVKKGLEEGVKKVAKTMRDLGFNISDIMTSSGLSGEEIQCL